MENSEENSENRPEAPKRKLSDNEEISPSVRHKEKERKMIVDEKSFNDLLASVQTIAKQLEVMNGEMRKINQSQDELKQSQEELKQSFLGVETRVASLEREVTELRAKEVNVEQLCEKIRILEKKSIINDQAKNNDTLMLRNLPKEVCDDKALLKNVLEKFFDTLNINLTASPYKANAFPVSNNRYATVELKLSSETLKMDAIQNFKKIKGDVSNNGQLLVEKFVQLPTDSQLNGKILMISNKLTPHYLELVKHARTYVNTHFEFVYETPDGRILVFRDGFHRIDTMEDVQLLVEKFDGNRIKKKPDKKNRPQDQQSSSSARVTRQSNRTIK